jgi:uncharacterized protein YqgV (UPF0045/DUF77 family)
MTVFALLAVTPVQVEGDIAPAVATAVDALEDHDVTYEVGPMATTIQAPDVETLLAAVGAAHGAVDADRVSTVLKIDDKRAVDHDASAKVDAVAAELGRPPRSS